MKLSLSKSPGTILLLDDDAAFLEMMALVLPTRWPVRLLLRPAECIAQLNRQSTLRDAEHWRQQEMVDRWRKIRMPLLPQILDYWSAQSLRFSIVKSVVIDYSMPAMDGLQVLQALQDWPGLRVLLTGRADDQLAVNAFNRGLINQFIPKQASDMMNQLLANLHNAQATAEPRTVQVWRSTLSPRQHALVTLPSVNEELAAFSEHHWVEHVVIGAPFGILGRDVAGAATWLQLEAASDLDELVELMEGMSSNDAELEEIRQGRQLPDYELKKAFGWATPLELQPAFSIGREEPLLGALFALGQSETSCSNSFQLFMSQQTERKIES